jgi:hypothetical protein
MPNPAYFKKGLSKTIPQLICVEIIYNHKDVIATDFSKQMQQAINLDITCDRLSGRQNHPY